MLMRLLIIYSKNMVFNIVNIIYRCECSPIMIRIGGQRSRMFCIFNRKCLTIISMDEWRTVGNRRTDNDDMMIISASKGTDYIVPNSVVVPIYLSSPRSMEINNNLTRFFITIGELRLVHRSLETPLCCRLQPLKPVVHLGQSLPP